MMQDQFTMFQESMKSEVDKNKHKIEDVEMSIREMKININSKINGE